MHRLSSQDTLRRFRIASVLVLLTFLMIPVATGLLIGALALKRHDWLPYVGIAVGVSVLFSLLSFIMSARLRCPLCMVPPLVNRRCSKHRTAETMFGSHKFKVAHSIIFADSFRCPYCGEPTAMEVRRRGVRR
ncbi:hypothetical protein HZ994_17980 [Akkermansiaceae bacterium]|nr:hypothetical protein HZ994_17980 [Akkermansiaceae bacterium]